MADDHGRAAVLTAYDADFEIRELPVPEPEPGALTVRIDTATICGSDIHVWKGHLEGVLPVHLPLILGHEMVGIVTAIGDGADRDSVGDPVRVGDRVTWAHEPCRQCHECTITQEPTLCKNRRLGMLEDCSKPPYFTGAFAEYGYVWPKSGRVKIPDDLKSEWASAASCAMRTVINAVEAAGRVDFLDSIVVQGAGPLGLFATALLSTHSPKHLIVIGGPDDRLQIAREWGATHTVSIAEHPTPEARMEAVKSITGARGASVALEVSGAPGAAAEGPGLLAPNGRQVLVGTIGGPPQAVNIAQITTRQLRVSGSMGGEIDAYWKGMRFMSEHQDRFDWDRMLGNRYGLSDLQAAMESAHAMREVKPVLIPTLS